MRKHTKNYFKVLAVQFHLKGAIRGKILWEQFYQYQYDNDGSFLEDFRENRSW